MGAFVGNRLGIAGIALALAGCGSGIGGETQDFAVTIERPPAAVFAAFAPVSGDGGAAVYPGLKVDRSKPSDNSLLFTIPSSGSRSSTLRFDFVPIRAGKATELRVFVDVPPITRTFEGKRKVVSETKVETELEKIVKRLRDNSGGAASDLSELLVAVAVATDPGLIPSGNPIYSRSGWAEELLGRAEEDELAAAADTAPDDERSLARQQYREERARESASAPMSDAADEEAGGDEDY